MPQRRPYLEVDIKVNTIRELPLDLLWQKGIRGILFDLDNTITAWRSMEIDAETTSWFEAFLERGFTACIVSNSDPKRVLPMGDLLGVPALAHAGKPGKRALLQACQILKLSPQQVAMVGDQLFTDVIAANRAGIMTILTEIAHPREFWGTQVFARRLERFVCRLSGKTEKKQA